MPGPGDDLEGHLAVASGRVGVVGATEALQRGRELVAVVEVEGDETVIVMLGTPQNATLGTPSEQTITIVDNDQYIVFLPLVLRQPAPLPAAAESDVTVIPDWAFLAARRLRADQ